MTEARVKICGLTRQRDAEAAVAAGAAYLGFVFADSPRRVEAAQISSWLDSVRQEAELVGVFRDQSLESVRRTVEELDLDLVQLHGSERGEAWLELPVRILEARPVGLEGPAASRFGSAAWAELLDTASPQGGGSGLSFDWSLAVERARERRVFLAGGLDPTNLENALATVRPFAVDVSSGVELRPGVKDAEKLFAFCQIARGS